MLINMLIPLSNIKDTLNEFYQPLTQWECIIKGIYAGINGYYHCKIVRYYSVCSIDDVEYAMINFIVDVNFGETEEMSKNVILSQSITCSANRIGGTDMDIKKRHDNLESAKRFAKSLINEKQGRMKWIKT